MIGYLATALVRLTCRPPTEGERKAAQVMQLALKERPKAGADWHTRAEQDGYGRSPGTTSAVSVDDLRKAAKELIDAMERQESRAPLPTFLSPTLYKYAEAQGYDMTGYRMYSLMPELPSPR